jgi:hypothetical protein
MNIAPAALYAGLCAVAFSQSFDTFRARISAVEGERGKCTVEVLVDGTAEVEVRGTEGRMRTLSGARSAWRRLDCNIPMPANPANFTFKAHEARGKQLLLKQPAGNGGVAIVRIEDSGEGSKAYKFDMEWRGATGGFEQGGLKSSEAGQGGVIDDGAFAGWTDRIEFRGPGEGYYQSFQGTDEVLSDCEVLIERSGRVQVRLKTKGKDPLRLSGRLVKADKNHLVANVSAGSIIGPMEIERDSRNHIKNLAMSGVGRNKFELRWRSNK